MKLITIGKFIASVISAVVAGIILYWYVDSLKPPPKKELPKIHYQEMLSHSASARISMSRGAMQETRVYAYLDLDDGQHAKQNMDVLVKVVFFGNGEKTIRAINSNLDDAVGNVLGQCRPIPPDSDGSPNLTMVMKKAYCVKTNKGRIASFKFNRLATSYGRDATIDIKMTVRTYDAKFQGGIH